MTPLEPPVHASGVPISSQLINPGLGQTRLPPTPFLGSVSRFWTLCVRLYVDTPPLVGITHVITRTRMRSPALSSAYSSVPLIRDRVIPFVILPVFRQFPHRLLFSKGLTHA
jgi:hypothetical protein